MMQQQQQQQQQAQQQQQQQMMAQQQQGPVPQYRQGMNPGMQGMQQRMPGQMGGMGPQGMMLSQVRSPPPIAVRSPNPGQSPRAGPMGMVPSPHTPPQHYGQVQGGQPSASNPNDQGDVNGASHNVMMPPSLGINDIPGGEPSHGAGQPSMTPQDQLSEFVKTL